jgi:hypothetical protein
MAGRVSLAPTGTPTANAVLCTVAFGVAYSAAPFVFAGAWGSTAVVAQQGTKAVTVSNITTTGFDLMSGTQALVAGTTYIYWYIVFGLGGA